MAVLTRLAPWSALSDLQKEMDQLVRTVFGGTGIDGEGRQAEPASRAWAPAVDVFSRGDDLVVRAELPGVDPEKDVDISVADGVLRIRGERRSEQRREGANYFRMETSYGAFERAIPLPDGIKLDEIKAVHKHGILEVVIPIAAQMPSVKKIPVQLEGETQQTIEAEASPDQVQDPQTASPGEDGRG
jgi:HSP20 family protein